MIIFTHSDAFPKIYPKNTASDFQVSVLQSESLSANTQIALLEIIVPPSLKAHICYIYCSAVAYSQCNGSWRRVLRVIDLQPNPSIDKFTFPNPIYFNLFGDYFESISFSLRDENNKLIEFDSGTKTVIVFEIKNVSV
jgi:hypothetical protein